MGYKAKNKQAPPQPIPGSDLYKDPKNKPLRKGSKKAVAAAAKSKASENGSKRKVDAVDAEDAQEVVKKQKKVATNGKGRVVKGKGKAEENFDTDEEVDDDILQPG
jgi:hypothetical protein